MADYMEEFRDPELASKLAGILSSYRGRTRKIMEVCGTHTVSFSRHGIRGVLPGNIRLVSGPGCPVCVTPVGYMDAALELAGSEDVIIATFGDLMRVPGSGSSLIREKSEGRDIRLVLSPLDSLKIAAENPGKRVVFLSVGFETTAPASALSVLKAGEEGLENYYILSANKTMPRVLEVLAADPETEIDGYIYPGHVSAIIGTGCYESLAQRLGIPGVVAGFEPLDLLYALVRMLELLESGAREVYNQYSRIVRREGNQEALRIMREVFEPCPSFWRGIGLIEGSGLKLRECFSRFDARREFGLADDISAEPEGCICGPVLKGTKSPEDCPLYGRTCTPDRPVGACMVSSEGTCAAYYRYGGI